MDTFATPMYKVVLNEMDEEHQKLRLDIIGYSLLPTYLEYEGKVYEFFEVVGKVGRNQQATYFVIS